jgi:hypothetical protein
LRAIGIPAHAFDAEQGLRRSRSARPMPRVLPRPPGVLPFVRVPRSARCICAPGRGRRSCVLVLPRGADH